MNRPPKASSQLCALISLAKILERPDLVRQVILEESLPHCGTPTILVAGVVKRGKSTLVNQILGTEISPTNLLPETAGLLAYRHQQDNLCAWAIQSDGQYCRLPLSVKRFRNLVSRSSGESFELAFRSGKYQIMSGVTLIDTVGESEAGRNETIPTASIPDEVVRSATGVIVVFGIPGVSATDVKFLARISELRRPSSLPTKLVIKNLDRSVTVNDLEAFRSELQDIESIESIVKDSMLVLEGSSEMVANVRTWIESLSEAAFACAPVRSSITEFTNELEHRRQTTKSPLNVPDHVVKSLPEELQGFVQWLSPLAIEQRAVKASEKIYQDQIKKYEDAHRAWVQGHWSLQSRVAELEAQRSAVSASARDARSSSSGIGCMVLVAFVISFVTFPIGPMIVGGVGWFWWLHQKEVGEENAAPFLIQEEEISRLLHHARQQLDQHMSSEPRRPPPPRELIPSKRKGRRSGS